MKGRELIKVAELLEKLAARQRDEPASRSAVNRAYYAAFGEATDYATRLGYRPTPGAGSHNKIWTYIGSHSDGNATRDAARRTLASQGLFLKERRQKADYERGGRLGRDDHVAAVKEARRIIRTLDAV